MNYTCKAKTKLLNAVKWGGYSLIPSQLVSSNWPQSGLIHFPRSAPVSLQRERLGLEWTGGQHAVQVSHQHLCEGGVWGRGVKEVCVGSEVCVGGVWGRCVWEGCEGGVYGIRGVCGRGVREVCEGSEVCEGGMWGRCVREGCVCVKVGKGSGVWGRCVREGCVCVKVGKGG